MGRNWVDGTDFLSIISYNCVLIYKLPQKKSLIEETSPKNLVIGENFQFWSTVVLKSI